MRVQILLKQLSLVCEPVVWRLLEIGAIQTLPNLYNSYVLERPVQVKFCTSQIGVNSMCIVQGSQDEIQTAMHCNLISPSVYASSSVLSPSSILQPH